MNTDANIAKSKINSLLTDAGFDLVGFASAKPVDEYHKILNDWLAQGFHADMTWMGRNTEKRQDVIEIMPSAKSVIVCLMNYKTTGRAYHTNTNKISRYAWGDDYHTIADAMLNDSVVKLSSLFPGIEFKHYTDTGPVLEKLWAWRAGLGWLGRNSLLINRTLGSWCFISVIITDMYVEPDKHGLDYCGSCKACVDSCPTSAIVSDKIVDAGKCISYWTIESKTAESFPADVRDNLNGWLFGCDICQEVCPWNRKTPQSVKAYFMPRYNESSLSDDMIENFDEEKFRLRFKNSPVKRRKLNGLRINLKELKGG